MKRYHYHDSLFQFHKGSIKTLRPVCQRCRDAVFQFHKGSIKTQRNDFCFVPVSNFNSIKVRLRPTSTYEAEAPIFSGFRMQRYEKYREKYVDVE